MHMYQTTAEHMLAYSSPTLENTGHHKLTITGEKATISLAITPEWVKTIPQEKIKSPIKDLHNHGIPTI